MIKERQKKKKQNLNLYSMPFTVLLFLYTEFARPQKSIAKLSIPLKNILS